MPSGPPGSCRTSGPARSSCSRPPRTRPPGSTSPRPRHTYASVAATRPASPACPRSSPDRAEGSTAAARERRRVVLLPRDRVATPPTSRASGQRSTRLVKPQELAGRLRRLWVLVRDELLSDISEDGEGPSLRGSGTIAERAPAGTRTQKGDLPSGYSEGLSGPVHVDGRGGRRGPDDRATHRCERRCDLISLVPQPREEGPLARQNPAGAVFVLTA